MEWTFMVIVAVVVGLVQAARLAGFPTRFAALLAILLGSVIEVALHGLSPPTLLAGVVAGLSAAGLYSGARATASP